MKESSRHITQIIQRYLSGQLTAEEQQHLDQWLEAKAQNRSFLESFRQAKNIEEDLLIVRKLDANKAWNKLTNKTPKDIKAYKRWYLGVAASIIFLIGSLFLWLGQSYYITTDNKYSAVVKKYDVEPATSGAILVLADGTKVPLTGDSTKTLTKNNHLIGNSNELIVKQLDKNLPVQYNSLIVPKASFYKMTLADGTKVWVNALSQLKFPNQFSPTERRVFLDGEAYFEVSHRINQPFIVESRSNEITVLGTHFNVNSYTENVRTTLAEGKVKVQHNNQTIELLPGEFSSSQNGHLEKGHADLQQDLSWHNNEFYFKKETIVNIAHQLSRWYDLEVKFRGNVQLDKEYTGSIERDVRLSQVLEMLSYVSNLKFELDGRQLIIETKT